MTNNIPQPHAALAEELQASQRPRLEKFLWFQLSTVLMYLCAELLGFLGWNQRSGLFLLIFPFALSQMFSTFLVHALESRAFRRYTHGRPPSFWQKVWLYVGVPFVVMQLAAVVSLVAVLWQTPFPSAPVPLPQQEFLLAELVLCACYALFAGLPQGLLARAQHGKEQRICSVLR